ncbi:hypothetical protein ABZO31_01480 [Streptomyces sp. HUAS MG47]|uniref:hypothetical protein n=1 Tax=Streptomyces solicamelliae TaxID=3231716 RepID=UPI003877E1A8
MPATPPPPGWGPRPPEQPPPPGPGGPQGPAWGPPPQPPPKRTNTCLVVALILGGLAVLAVVGIVIAFVAVDETTDLPGEGREDRDVRISSCEVDGDTRWPHAGLTVTNLSSKPSDYAISVEFVTASGTRVAEANAAVDNLAPDKVAEVTAQSLTQVDGPVTCNITDVFRVAS